MKVCPFVRFPKRKHFVPVSFLFSSFYETSKVWPSDKKLANQKLGQTNRKNHSLVLIYSLLCSLEENFQLHFNLLQQKRLQNGCLESGKGNGAAVYPLPEVLKSFENSNNHYLGISLNIKRKTKNI